MPTPQRLPIVNADDGTWGDILRQYLMKEHYEIPGDTDNAANGGHQNITVRPGTATAGTAPLKFTSGTLLTTPEAGAVEFNTDNLYFTKTTGSTRQTIASYDYTTGATGDIYYRNGGTFTRIPIGGTGTVLTVTGGIPTWGSSTGMLASTYDPAGITQQVVGTTASQILTNKDLTSTTNTFPTLNQSTTGNAATATALQTARTINGVSFNGTANISLPSIVSWQAQATSTTASVGNGYVSTSSGLVTITLPTTYAVGDTVRVAGSGAGGWKIAQPAGDNIKFSTTTTTAGTSGYLASTNSNDAVELIGTVANTTWTVTGSIGNIMVV